MARNNLKQVQNKIERKIKRVLNKSPRLIGEESVKFFKRNFDKQGFLGDSGREAWKARNPDSDPGRAILVGQGSGRLRDSIRVISAKPSSIVVGTDVPYAKIHNEGGKVKGVRNVRPYKRQPKGRKRHNVKGHTRKVNYTMPQRKFIGNSKTLNRHLAIQIKALIKREMK